MNHITALPGALARLTRLRLLKASHNRMAEIENVVALGCLEILEVVGNKLTALPQLGKLEALQTLDVQYNFLTTLPPLPRRLELLRCGGNPITAYPTEPAPSLTELDLKGNFESDATSFLTLSPALVRLAALDAQLSLASFNSLKDLQELFCHGNNLQQIPDLAPVVSLNKLSITNNLCPEIPSSIAALQKLQEVDLSRNLIHSFPVELCRCAQLVSLSLSGNQIASLPNEIGELKLLGLLDLSYNSLRDLPKTVETLGNLRDLLLSGNQLTQVPALPPSLRRLYLASNQLRDLQLPKQQNFHILNLALNELKDLPDALWETGVEELVLDGNLLEELSPNILRASKLKRLNASGNQLTSLPALPPTLTELNVAENRIFLPPDCRIFENLPALVDCDLSANALK